MIIFYLMHFKISKWRPIHSGVNVFSSMQFFLIQIKILLFIMSNWLQVSIDSGIGLAPVQCQAITWTNVDQDL